MFFIILPLIIFLILILYLDTKKPKNFPNGPAWYPIFGSVFSVLRARKTTGYLVKGIHSLAENYKTSSVIGLKIGNDKTVIMLNGDAFKEMCTNEDMDGRPIGIFFASRTWGERWGIIMTDGDMWQEHRRFVIRYMKEFGYARRGMIDIIQNETVEFYNDIKKLVEKNGGQVIISMSNFGGVYILNTLWKLMAGVRYNPENAELQHLQHILHELFASVDMIGALFSHFPFLRFIAPGISGYKNYLDTHNQIFTFIQKEIEKHKIDYKTENEPLDLMDVYLREIELSAGEKSTFTEKQLLAVCMDMFVAGTETTGKTFSFLFVNIVRNLDYQNKCFEEIERVVGLQRLPSIEDRSNMPFCEAAVLEALRFFISFSFGIPHRALRDTKLCGFDIPKDTTLIGSFHEMMTNTDTWGTDSEEYRPERFIKNGKITIPEQFQPFSFGKHRCIGEILAKSNLFLFLTTLLQNFKFLIPAGDPMPCLDPIDGATPSVKPYNVLIVSR